LSKEENAKTFSLDKELQSTFVAPALMSEKEYFSPGVVWETRAGDAPSLG
jgi:hypothetical protein